MSCPWARADGSRMGRLVNIEEIPKREIGRFCGIEVAESALPRTWARCEHSPLLLAAGPPFWPGCAFQTRVRPRSSISVGVPTPKNFKGPGSPAYSIVVWESAPCSAGSNPMSMAFGA